MAYKGSNTPNANFDGSFNDFYARRTIELPGTSTDEGDDIEVILVRVQGNPAKRRAIFRGTNGNNHVLVPSFTCTSTECDIQPVKFALEIQKARWILLVYSYALPTSDFPIQRAIFARSGGERRRSFNC